MKDINLFKTGEIKENKTVTYIVGSLSAIDNIIRKKFVGTVIG